MTLKSLKSSTYKKLIIVILYVKGRERKLITLETKFFLIEN